MRTTPHCAHTRSRMEAGKRRRYVQDPAAFHGRQADRSKEQSMKWETPQASDQRFGFEITMYISTR
jgi:coenzyme PQQ precursor peptide PqqA